MVGVLPLYSSDHLDEVLISSNHLLVSVMDFLSAFYSSDHLDEVLISSNHLLVLVMDFLSAIFSSDHLDEVLILSNHLFVLVMDFLSAFYSSDQLRDGFRGGPCGPGPRAPTFWGPPQNQYWLGFI